MLTVEHERLAVAQMPSQVEACNTPQRRPCVHMLADAQQLRVASLAETGKAVASATPCTFVSHNPLLHTRLCSMHEHLPALSNRPARPASTMHGHVHMNTDIHNWRPGCMHNQGAAGAVAPEPPSCSSNRAPLPGRAGCPTRQGCFLQTHTRCRQHNRCQQQQRPVVTFRWQFSCWTAMCCQPPGAYCCTNHPQVGCTGLATLLQPAPAYQARPIFQTSAGQSRPQSDAVVRCCCSPSMAVLCRSSLLRPTRALQGQQRPFQQVCCQGRLTCSMHGIWLPTAVLCTARHGAGRFAQGTWHLQVAARVDVNVCRLRAGWQCPQLAGIAISGDTSTCILVPVGSMPDVVRRPWYTLAFTGNILRKVWCPASSTLPRIWEGAVQVLVVVQLQVQQL